MIAVIIDDEKNGALGLKLLLQKHCKNVTVSAIVHSASEGIKSILEIKPDLVFLDIEMSPDTGFDVIEATRHLDYQVVFTTAYDHYAIKAFRARAVDYLLKPIDTEELKQAVQNACSRAQKNGNTVDLELILKSLKVPDKKIPLPTGKGITLVEANEIVYLESDSNYTTVFLKSGEKLLISKTLKNLEEKLNPGNFCRVHAAFIVNLGEISQYIKGDGGQVILKNKSSIPVSRSFKQELLNRIGV